jgi:RDD family
MHKVIEPSEIIVDQPSINEGSVNVNPWNRFLARFFDYALLSFLLSFTKLHGYMFFNFLPLKYLIWIPVETVFMSAFGYTPGKYLLKIRVLHRRKKLNLLKALKRSFLVWIKGIGLGINFVMPFAMIVAYQHLYQKMKTKWDLEENISTSQKPVDFYIIVIVAIILVGYEFLNS